MEEGRSLLGTDPRRAGALLRSALALWRGPAFPDLAAGVTPPVEVAALDEERLSALEDRIDADLDAGEGAELVPELTALVAAHPLRERFHAQRILALYRAGRQAEALDGYRVARELLLEELGVDPGPALQRLEQAVLRQEPALLASVPDPRRHPALPEPARPIIGRRDELDTLGELLSDHQIRIVSLTGPGGTGKSRLALELALACQPVFPDGVFFVPLAPLADPRLVVPEIARMLNVKPAAQRPLLEVLGDRLDGRSSLVVLDNLEHLLTAVPQLADLVAAASSFKLVVTSRAALRISAEHEFPVSPLPLPEHSGSAIAATELSRNECVQLFVERAQAVMPNFALSEDNAPVVAAICRRLDGLPLAIELAAARMRVLSAEAILARLTMRLKLLTGGARELAPRQQTLRATIEWSYHLLEPDDRQLLERLGVFVGGWTIEAAEAVCDNHTDSDDAVLSGLDSLVGHSLVQRRHAVGAELRFGMLETIHEYAEELLKQSADGRLHRRHAEYYATIAETSAPDLAGTGQANVLARLNTEHDNLRAALAWSLSGDGDIAVAMRLTGALWHFWEMNGDIDEGRRWFDNVLSQTSNGHLSPLLLPVYAGAGTLAWAAGDYDQATRLHENALRLSRSLGDRASEAFALNNLGAQSVERADYETAQSLCQQAAALAREIGDDRISGIALHNLAEIAVHRAEYPRATQLYTESLAAARQIGDSWLVAASLRGMAILQLQNGDPHAAEDGLRESLQLVSQVGENSWVAENLEGLAAVAQTVHQPIKAAQLLGAADAIRRRIGVPVQPAGHHTQVTLLNNVRSTVTNDAFNVAWNEGQSLPAQHFLSKPLKD